jgi:hypothetical protein
MSGPAATPAVSRKAVYSLACGVLAFAAIYLHPFAGALVSLPSIASALHARREIAASDGQQSGDTVAVIGLMVGGGALLTVALSWALDVLG